MTLKWQCRLSQKWRRLLPRDPLTDFFFENSMYIKRDLVVVALGRLSMCEGCNPFCKRKGTRNKN
jgi:hypothetical protein